MDPNNAKASLAVAGLNSKSNDDINYMESLKPVFLQEDVDIDLKIAKLLPFISKVAESSDRELAAAALELTDILEQVHPENPKPYSAAGDLLYHSGQPERALEKYEMTIGGLFKS